MYHGAQIFVLTVILILVRSVAPGLVGENNIEPTVNPPIEISTHSSSYAGDEFETTTFVPTTVNSEENSNSSEVKPFLLPGNLKPLTYDLGIIPILHESIPNVEDVDSPYHNLSRFDAPGEVQISLKCLQFTDNITLHAHHEVKIDPSQIKVTWNLLDKQVEIQNVTRDNDTDFLVIQLAEPICNDITEDLSGNKADVILNIKFISRVASDRLNGLYLDYYIDPETKEKRYLSTTLFAPHKARLAFPCWDEPGLKANFTVRIGRKEDDVGYSSISNTPRISSSDKIDGLDGYVWDKFETTPPIPTYIVALITTDFASRTINLEDIELKLHAPEYLLKRTKTLNMTDYKYKQGASNLNPNLLQDPLFFIASILDTKPFEVPYPLRKLDIIALPHFFFNAMENIGATTFKYPVILNIENVTTVSELLKLNYVVGHEMAHNWFGNILTPSSWSYVWLKESFSDFIGRVLVDSAMNGYQENFEDLLNYEVQVAMRYDQGADTHPLENTIKSASDVGEIYTDIPYRKGASIVYMTQSFLTVNGLAKALVSLFLERNFGNFDQNDLFSYFEQQQKKKKILEGQGLDQNVSIHDILDTWTKQCGYPVVQIREEGKKFFLKQNFFPSRPYQTDLLNQTTEMPKIKCLNESTMERFWWIPVTILDVENTLSPNDSIIWMPPNDDEKVVEIGKGYRVTNINGYFRIMYSEELLEKILREIMVTHHLGTYPAYVTNKNETIGPKQRSQLLDDYFAFAFYLNPHGKVPVKLLFHIFTFIMPYESEQVVWNTFFANLKLPVKLLRTTEYFPPVQDYIVHILKPLRLFLESQLQVTEVLPCIHYSSLRMKMKLVQFRALVLQWQCELDAEECITLAKTSTEKFMQSGDPSSIPADDQSTLYCAAVKNASENDLDSIWQFFEGLYFSEYYSVQRDRYLKALSCSRNETYLRRLLSWTTNVSLDFHDVDRVTLVKLVVANPVGREIIFDFISENFDILYKSASAANPVTEAVKAYVDYVNSPEKLKKMEEFILKHKDAMEKKKKFLEKQRRNAKLNMVWVQNIAEDIMDSAKLAMSRGHKTIQASCSGSYKAQIQDGWNLDEYLGVITKFNPKDE